DSGRFRADLAQRLSGIVLHVPALADRVEDIPLLAAHFATSFRAGAVITRGAERELLAHKWPGNVRELRQVIHSAMIFAGDVLDIEALDTAFEHRPRRTDNQLTVPAAERAEFL